MTPHFIQIVLAALGSGGLVGFLTWIISNRKDKRTGLETVIERFDADNVRLREDLQKVRDDFDRDKEERLLKEQSLQREITSLRSKLLIMESAHLDLPVPQWLKDKDGTMLALNAAYENLFLSQIDLEAVDYIGTKDHEVWPQATADAFVRHDKTVMRTRKPLQTQEVIDFGTHMETWEILKYPRYSGTTLIGIGGIAFKKLERNVTPAQT